MGHIERFFSKIALKVCVCFLNLTDSVTRKQELSPDMHFWHVISGKSHDFQDISKISGTNVSRTDTYKEKKKSRFPNDNFQRQNFFLWKTIFLIFAKKIGQKIRIFGNEGYCSKEKSKSDFLMSSPWKSNVNYGRKNCLKKMGKKSLLAEFSADFYETFGFHVSCF